MGTLDDLTEGLSGKRILTEWRETQSLAYAMGGNGPRRARGGGRAAAGML